MKKRVITLFTVVLSILCGCSRINTETAVLNEKSTVQAISVTTSSNDYIYTVKDVKIMQDFLLNRAVTDNMQDKPYDMDNNGVWNVFDLCMLKHEMLTPAQNDNDTVVVYFSRTNNTEKIANYIINITGLKNMKLRRKFHTQMKILIIQTHHAEQIRNRMINPAVLKLQNQWNLLTAMR